ncbi:hypothetical protein ACFXKD_05375 [Nocardiopsis aegyptia]|uniref:hypothetical protein n=1 Tax=Nocardiopsis aegyptia TaxID=220378 RepID=UPI003673199F
MGPAPTVPHHPTGNGRSPPGMGRARSAPDGQWDSQDAPRTAALESLLPPA